MDPLPVWKVELATGLAKHDVAGLLSLQDDHLLFTANDGGVAPVPFGAIERAKRLRLSAVIVVRWLDDGDIRETAYYATRPPPLERSTRDETRSTKGRMFPTTRRMQQRRNSTYLAEAGTTMKPLLKGWVVEIERRRAVG